MKSPSDFHPDLDEANIAAIAKLIKDAYEEAAEHKMEGKGDTNWGLGCRRHEWAKQSIRLASASGVHPYLGILIDDGNRFVFKIGEVPVRFKRDDAENPSAKVFSQYETESKQLSLLGFDGVADPSSLCWRILIDVDFGGEVIRAVFIGAETSGSVKCFYEIPLAALHLPPVSIPTTSPAGVQLESVEVTVKPQAGDRKTDSNENE
jgi:hypothetical protein